MGYACLPRSDPAEVDVNMILSYQVKDFITTTIEPCEYFRLTVQVIIHDLKPDGLILFSTVLSFLEELPRSERPNQPGRLVELIKTWGNIGRAYFYFGFPFSLFLWPVQEHFAKHFYPAMAIQQIEKPSGTRPLS